MALDNLRLLSEGEFEIVLTAISQVDPDFLCAAFSKIKFGECPNEDLPGPCWIWTGGTDSKKGIGYGKLWYAGAMRRAHRIIYEKLTGRVLKIDEDGHHVCEQSLCVNPWHQEIVSCELHSKRGPPANWKGYSDEPAPF